MALTVTTTQFSGGVSEITNPDEVRGVANYLYWLCGKFALEGQDIVESEEGGGTVITDPSNPS